MQNNTNTRIAEDEEFHPPPGVFTTRDKTLLQVIQEGGPHGEHAQQCYIDSLSYLDIMCQFLYLYLQETEGAPLPIDNPLYSKATNTTNRQPVQPSVTTYSPNSNSNSNSATSANGDNVVASSIETNDPIFSLFSTTVDN